MIYKKVENTEGEYESQDGKYYNLLICNKATGPYGINIGWREYKSLKIALKALKLKPKI